MIEKNRELGNTRVLLDTSELVGISQVASVSSAEAEISLSDLGRVLSKKGGGETLSKEDCKGPASFKKNK